MPKARKQKSRSGNTGKPRVRSEGVQQQKKSVGIPQGSAVTSRRLNQAKSPSPQSLILPVMVALGCWGMAVSFLFFYNDPNHLLYGGMAVCMALIWSFSLGLRIRRMLLVRQKI
jgi:hypothetical protein